MDDVDVAFFAAREPVFDRTEVIHDAETFEREVAPDFREVGASGNVYDREAVKRTVLARLAGTEPVSLAGGYRIEAFVARLVADRVVLLTYDLHGQGRVTRRSSLYRRTAGTWQVFFHQGTVVEGAAPQPPDRPEPSRG